LKEGESKNERDQGDKAVDYALFGGSGSLGIVASYRILDSAQYNGADYHYTDQGC
jgi:hypothetical protein